MIVGKKIILNRPKEEHNVQLLEWRNNPEFRQHYREYREISAEKQITYWKEEMIENSSFEYFVISPAEDKNKIIGVVGLTYIHPVYRTCEFTITIGDSDYRSGGYGSDALRTLIKYGFEQLNMNRIGCEVYSNNSLAIDIYRHIGFQDEGLLRETVFKNGKYLDSYILSMLKSDYLKMKKDRKFKL